MNKITKFLKDNFKKQKTKESTIRYELLKLKARRKSIIDSSTREIDKQIAVLEQGYQIVPRMCVKVKDELIVLPVLCRKIAVNKDGGLYAYSHTPTRHHSTWIVGPTGDETRITHHICDLEGEHNWVDSLVDIYSPLQEVEDE